MTTFKFLARGRMGPFSRVRWPEPGAWIEAEGGHGVHVCRPADLAHWLHEELWETETDGERVEGVDCLVVRRARLVRPVPAWSEAGAARLADACIARAAALLDERAGALAEILEDAREAARLGYFAVAAFSAAVVPARLHPAGESDEAYRRERAWQSRWIAREMLGITN